MVSCQVATTASITCRYDQRTRACKPKIDRAVPKLRKFNATGSSRVSFQAGRLTRRGRTPEGLCVTSQPGPSGRASLNFHHVFCHQFRGRDFLRRDENSRDHRAGMLHCPMYGHGARSASVTAILRTLLQDLAAKADDALRNSSCAVNAAFSTRIIEQRIKIHFRLGVLSALSSTSAQRRAYASAGPSAAILSRIVRLVKLYP